MKKWIYSIVFVVVFQGFSQSNGQRQKENWVLHNRQVSREIQFSSDSLYTKGLRMFGDSISIVEKSRDFSFRLNDREYDGFSGWKLQRTDSIGDDFGGKGLKLTVVPTLENAPNFVLELHYLLYPNLPLIRKWISIKNTGSVTALKLEALNIEDLQTTLDNVHSVVHHNYARMKHLGRYVGDWDDPVVVVHHSTERRGMALGNEAVGVIKRTAYHTKDKNVEIGLTHQGQSFPFRKYIAPQSEWHSPKTFIALYSNRDDGFEIVDREVNRFITLHMGTRITQMRYKPTFVYNTWYPFRTNINDSLIRSVAKAAADCGIMEFVVDDGWQVNHHGKSSTRGWGENYGDWLVDENKFPNGLAPTFNYIKSLGMKPGLWVSIASATKDAQVFQEHPEWFVENAKGKPGNLHYESDGDTGFYTASFGTDWRNYIQDKILGLVQEHGLEYAKLDLAIVTSPYVNNDSISGSYAKDHPLHRDHHESFYVLYHNMLKMFDELHQQAPELFIDCTFETAGKLQLMDYAIAKHAEGNWLSNFEEPSPLGALRVRQMAWWRSPALPASSLVIGNLPLDDTEFIFGLKSLIGTLPIVLGDPREIPETKRQRIRAWSEWMQRMQDTYDYMSYRRDLHGFGEPREGHWDGWQRINFKTMDGGIFGVFRQGALESSRQVFLKDLDSDRTYDILEAVTGTTVFSATGADLMSKGFTVVLKEAYDADLFEVRSR